MITVLFVDTSHPKTYDFATLESQALGGTEASLLRTAQIFSENKIKVFIYQQARRTPQNDSKMICFIGPGELDQIDHPDHIILLRKYQQIKKFARRFAKAKLYLWIHTYKNIEYSLKRFTPINQRFTVIANSNTHALHTNRLLNLSVPGRFFSLFKARIAVHHCYNPIPEGLQQFKSTQRDKNKLLFLSSPNKGLDQVVSLFKRLKNNLPDLRLFIANPGYRPDANIKDDGIIALGPLPHSEIMQHIANSLCVFYPQDSFAETFGLIYAEANAVGTPVLAHDIGSAREILHPNNSLIDVNDFPQIRNTIQQWQKQLPEVQYNQQFGKTHVLNQWLAVFSNNT